MRHLGPSCACVVGMCCSAFFLGVVDPCRCDLHLSHHVQEGPDERIALRRRWVSIPIVFVLWSEPRRNKLSLLMLSSGANNCPNMTLESMTRMNREPGLDRGVNCLHDATLHCKFSYWVPRNCTNVLVSAYPACREHYASGGLLY